MKHLFRIIKKKSLRKMSYRLSQFKNKNKCMLRSPNKKYKLIRLKIFQI